MTTLNAAFEQKLAQEDEGYKSTSENFNIPTPLRKMQKIHHISSIKNASFDPNLVTPPVGSISPQASMQMANI